MERLYTILDGLKALDINDIIKDTVVSKEDEILYEVKDQLWNGKRPDGTDIAPSYLNDPYFKSPTKAVGYMNWKNRITANPGRNIEAPNLYINGYFYDTLELKVEGEQFMVSSEDSLLGRSVVNKYGLDTFGVNERYLERLLGVIKDKILTKLNDL